MATDGVGIINGDRANNTYWGIMDLYDEGADHETILDRFPLFNKNYFDDFDNEIYVTAVGLAYWEIGLMTDWRLEFIREIIAKNACVNEWYEYSEEDGEGRRQVLKEYLEKISVKNLAIRERMAYKLATDFIFDENEILVFQLDDGCYCAVVCMKIEQYRGDCTYWLVPTTYCGLVEPNLGLIESEFLLGITIMTDFHEKTVLAIQSGIDSIWDHLDSDTVFCFGFVARIILHEDFQKMMHHFKSIGSLDFNEGLKSEGSTGYVQHFDQFNESFNDLDEYIKTFGYKKFPVKLFLHQEEIASFN